MSVATVTNITQNSVVKHKLVTFTWNHASTYTAGGEKLTPAMLGLQKILYFGIEMQNGYVGRYDYTNEKVMFYWTGAGTAAVLAEISSTDLSAINFNCMVIGR